jgi:hypothetical protein
MSHALAPTLPNFGHWVVQPAADTLVQTLVRGALQRSSSGARFASQLHEDTGIRLTDMLDHVIVPADGDWRVRIAEAGFRICATDDGTTYGIHDDGIFPDIVLGSGDSTALAIRVESVADFLAAQGASADIEGPPLSTYRRACVWSEGGVECWVVERHGHVGFEVPEPPADQRLRSQDHLDRLRRRQRLFDDVGRAFDHTEMLVSDVVSDLGADWACALFLRAEREYWERRNRAARVQKARQDALGIGWANDDHHTYDASRQWFHRTIQILERLGFACRERFYAGAEAGWGSQILEQPVVGTVVFADIDLAPSELTGDFAHAHLDPLPQLRRAGLWCALHGESMLEAGLNHLECTYDAHALLAQLAQRGVRMMAPFSNFPHLFQQLTEGERWPVRPDRIEALQRAGQISEVEAADFRQHGAIGSHLENLERNQGYKGFNQPGISEVLQIIDPRANLIGAIEP